MSKKGFAASERGMRDNATSMSFVEKRKPASPDSSVISRSVDLYKKNDTWCFVLHTSSMEEFKQGRNSLKKAGFFYDNTRDTTQPLALMFQKREITVLANSDIKDEQPVYTFELQKKEFPNPGTVLYGEDLLKFDSHEHLISFFGAKNVKEDMYRFSETEVRKCSILFGNTSQQAVFIWDDANNLYKISFIMIGGILPTASTADYTGKIGQSKWIMKSGVYAGMRLKDLLKLNGNDFEFYGRDSDFFFMVEPTKTRNLAFDKIGIQLDCFDCRGASILEAKKVSAATAVDQGLAIHVSCLMISP